MARPNPFASDVMARPADQRVEYALELLAYYLDPQPAFFDACLNLRLGLAARDIRVLHALDQRRGRLVSRHALQAAAMSDVPQDAWGGPDTICRRVAQIRRKLGASPYPLTLSSVSGLGYRLDGPASFQIGAPDA